MIHFLKKLDLILLIVIALYAIVVSWIDLFDINSRSPLFTDSNYSLISVLILSIISLHLVVNNIQQENFQSKSLEESSNIITSLDGVSIQLFKDTEEMEKYLSKRILEAKIEICDLTWKNTISLGFSTTPRKKSRKLVEKSINRVSKLITYREIFVFNDESRILKLKERIAQNNDGYSCRYFPDESQIPRIQFVVIDKKEIVFASSAFPKLCSVTHPAIAENFYQYYNQVWESALHLKEGSKIFTDNINKIISIG